jgi:hypothetical protein
MRRLAARVGVAKVSFLAASSVNKHELGCRAYFAKLPGPKFRVTVSRFKLESGPQIAAAFGIARFEDQFLTFGPIALGYTSRSRYERLTPLANVLRVIDPSQKPCIPTARRPRQYPAHFDQGCGLQLGWNATGFLLLIHSLLLLGLFCQQQHRLLLFGCRSGHFASAPSTQSQPIG